MKSKIIKGKIKKARGVYLVNLLPKLSEPVAQPEHGKPTSHRENPHKLADNLGAAVARLELVAYYVQFTQSHL